MSAYSNFIINGKMIACPNFIVIQDNDLPFSLRGSKKDIACLNIHPLVHRIESHFSKIFSLVDDYNSYDNNELKISLENLRTQAEKLNKEVSHYNYSSPSFGEFVLASKNLAEFSHKYPEIITQSFETNSHHLIDIFSSIAFGGVFGGGIASALNHAKVILDVNGVMFIGSSIMAGITCYAYQLIQYQNQAYNRIDHIYKDSIKIEESLNNFMTGLDAIEFVV